jgi:BirA family biotin operon repressor/biotin-[acetyl-CoA-carboxylase] ligase
MTAGIRLDVVDSTLDALHARAAAGAPDGTWLVALEQRAGRGSRGRTWHSPRGGLWLSVLRRAAGSPAGFDLLSLRAGLATARILDQRCPGLPVMLKWPNDVMVRDRKVGGLLAEARWQGDRLQWVVIGLGLNVRNRIPEALAGRAAALGDDCPELTAEALAEPLAHVLGGVDLDAPELTVAELADYATRDWLRGRPVSAPVEGTAAGVGSDGRLAVRDRAGLLHRVSAGEVLPD